MSPPLVYARWEGWGGGRSFLLYYLPGSSCSSPSKWVVNAHRLCCFYIAWTSTTFWGLALVVLAWGGISPPQRDPRWGQVDLFLLTEPDPAHPGPISTPPLSSCQALRIASNHITTSHSPANLPIVKSFKEINENEKFSHGIALPLSLCFCFFPTS